MSQESPQILDYSSLRARGLRAPLPARSAAFALSATLMGMALHLTDGLYSPVGLLVLTLSFVLCALAVLAPHTAGPSAQSAGITHRTFVIFLAGLVLIQLLSMPVVVAGASEATVPAVSQRPFYVGVGCAVVGLAIVTFGRRPWVLAGFILMLASFAGIGIWKVRTAPEPWIDVFIFHRDAAHALAQHINPYTITFPNIYGEGAYVYGPGVIQNGRLLFGYPYPPLVLLVTAAGELMLGDPRYAQFFAMLATAVMIALIRRDQIGMLAAALFLFTPRALYILELAWTEPVSVMLLTAIVLCILRAPKLMPVMLGLLLASKQYLPAVVLLTPLLFDGADRWRKLTVNLLVAGIVGAVVSLPLMLWDFPAFWQSAITLQMRQPYRRDSLGFLAWWGYHDKLWVGPFWLAFVAMFASMGLSFWRVPRGIAGFVWAFALSYFAFFIFNKQAFANYYFLVLGALCLAIVTPRRTTPEPIN